jgi:hypothetical protein
LFIGFVACGDRKVLNPWYLLEVKYRTLTCFRFTRSNATVVEYQHVDRA